MNFKKTAKVISKIFIWILGILFSLMLILQILLLPPIFTPIVNSMAGDYVNASVNVGRAYGSIFDEFPRVSLTLEDLEITYPHERYDSLARAGAQHEFLYMGCGETEDTLAIIERLHASVSLQALLWDEIKIPQIEIVSPTLYAHSYDADNANWNIFGSTEVSEPSDTTETEASEPSAGGSDDEMGIILKKINITGNPRIIYTDSQDSMFVAINMINAGFDGNFEPNALHRTMADAHINKFLIEGRYGSDTLAGMIHSITLSPKGNSMNMNIMAKAYTEYDVNRMMVIPIMFNGDLSIPEDEGLAVALHNIKSSIGSIPAEGYIDVKMRSDSTLVDGKLDIKDHKIQNMLNMYMSYLDENISRAKTDTRVSVYTTVNGVYGGCEDALPAVDVDIVIPDSWVDHKTFPDKINLGLTAKVQMDKAGLISADVERAVINTYGLDFNSNVNTTPLGEEDREIILDGNMRMSLDSLRAFLPDTTDITAVGGLEMALKGSTRMSYLDMYKFSQSDLTGSMSSRKLLLDMPEDSIKVDLSRLDLRLEPTVVDSLKNENHDGMLMGIFGTLGSADIQYADAFTFTGKDIDFNAMNSKQQTDETAEEVKFVSGEINAKNMFVEDSEGTSIKLENTYNYFEMSPDETTPTIPALSLNNKNLRITYTTPDNRAILTDSKIDVNATMNTINLKANRKAWLDTLAKKYPDVPRDSLMYYARKSKKQEEIPSWMSEESFRESDLQFGINGSARRYFRQWDVEGNVAVRTGIIMTPQFPLRNIIRGISFSFNNDMASIDSVRINAGESQLRASGSVNNLKKALLRNDAVKLDLKITSSSVDADELLNAYAIGSQYQPQAAEEGKEELTNAEFFKQVTTDTVRIEAPSSSLVVIPGNLVADIGINMSGIKYQKMDISRMSTDIHVKQRCAQILDATFESNVGNAYLDAFYAARTKQDIKTGFCLDLKDVTSEEVIALMPQISSVMPMIESIKGKLNCEVAVTAELDTTMNIRMSTVNGIARLGGKNLTISNDETYTAVARKLMFKNKKKGEIKELTAEGTINDKKLEIYPFILALDRYKLGLSGIQYADGSYKHHVSVLRSPILIRLGLNMSGPNYDDMDFSIGKALYKPKKIPSFTSAIDQTKIDLRHSIRSIFKTGVDETLENSDNLTLIRKHEEETGYFNAAEMVLEALSEEDMAKLENSESTEETLENLTVSVLNAVQEVLKK